MFLKNTERTHNVVGESTAKWEAANAKDLNGQENTEQRTLLCSIMCNGMVYNACMK